MSIFVNAVPEICQYLSSGFGTPGQLQYLSTKNVPIVANNWGAAPRGRSPNQQPLPIPWFGRGTTSWGWSQAVLLFVSKWGGTKNDMLLWPQKP